MTIASKQDLDLVFGPGTGTNAAERARQSDRCFVRSQVQLTAYTPAAKGHVFTAKEALRVFGYDSLVTVVREGAVTLAASASEPATSLKTRRTTMGIAAKKLAAKAGISLKELEKAETPGQLSKIRDLERLCQALALNDEALGSPDAGADKQLGVRLRQYRNDKGVGKLSDGIVLSLAEAAWIIDRQTKLAQLLDDRSRFDLARFPKTEWFFGRAAYEEGYRLAAQARALLQMPSDAPVLSVRALIEDTLKIPLVQMQLGSLLAGATLANGQSRGIVINEVGRNSNVWVRRMTLAHELAHLLCDPDNQLNKLQVDRYDEIDKREPRTAPLEARANAFAVAFLAPPEAIRHLIINDHDLPTLAGRLMNQFGISATATWNHVHNLTGRELDIGLPPQPSEQWITRENMARDYLPIRSTEVGRRGRFALLVIRAFKSQDISSDTAAMLLQTTSQEIEISADSVENLLKEGGEAFH